MMAVWLAIQEFMQLESSGGASRKLHVLDQCAPWPRMTTLTLSKEVLFMALHSSRIQGLNLIVISTMADVLTNNSQTTHQHAST